MHTIYSNTFFAGIAVAPTIRHRHLSIDGIHLKTFS